MCLPGKLTPRPVCKMTAGANVQNFLENALHRDEFHVLAPFAELRGILSNYLPCYHLTKAGLHDLSCAALEEVNSAKPENAAQGCHSLL